MTIGHTVAVTVAGGVDLHNERDGTLKDVTGATGIQGERRH